MNKHSAVPDDTCTFGCASSDDTPRKERRDAAAHRQRILSVARELFAARGVDATSMAEIARTAQVGQGTLYRRYAHKGDLCAALLHDNMARFRADVEARLGQRDESALAQLESFLMRLADFNEDNAPLLAAIGDAACGDRRTTAYHSPLYVWLRTVTVALLQRAVEQGEAQPLDLEIAADTVLAPLAIDLYLYQRHELGYSPERITASLHRVVFNGLRMRQEQTTIEYDS